MFRHLHLEPRYKRCAGQELLVQAKEPLVISYFRSIGENHGSGSVPDVHNQCFSGASSNHSVDLGFVAR